MSEEKRYILDPREGDKPADHRVVQALVILGLKLGKARVKSGERINVSWGTFIDDMHKIGANVRYEKEEEVEEKE